MWQERLSEFVTLFIVVNPLAALPVFLAVTRGFDAAAHRQGHGLGNTALRIRESGGSYALDSAPGQGTSIVILCRLPEHPR